MHTYIYTYIRTYRDEIIAYAQYLGMDPEQDEDLLWIAHLALTAPLPAGWTEHEVRNECVCMCVNGMYVCMYVPVCPDSAGACRLG